ncbi:MAG: hypothetical protein XD78_1475 [Desulfotomaculum sp. 46_296]|nr:MAG: hypothetical protein XD78_1475 [Desulfotomaculum sp. 46_296]HAU32645.1 hypothetical protein [Desulfotomaculum sp.]
MAAWGGILTIIGAVLILIAGIMNLFGMPGVPWLGAVTNIILGLGLIFWPLSVLLAPKKQS